MLSFPFPYIANTAGWFTAELGRQPWLAYGLMRTAAGTSPTVSAGSGLFTLLGFTGMYFVLGVAFLFLLARQFKPARPDRAHRLRPIVRRLYDGNSLVRHRCVHACDVHHPRRVRSWRGHSATLFIARSEDDRRAILRSIGPYWDGNEVWILAAGGTLYFAFPMLYASSFSGFYLPLMIVLWLFMLRALGIEFRHLSHHPLWLSFWHTVFGWSSALLAVFLGAALGNVVRGVPLNAEGYFFEPLWTTFTVVPEAGILDWFTVLLGLVAFCTLAVHGGNYIAMKTSGDLQERARRFAAAAWWGMAATALASLAAVGVVRPGSFYNFFAAPAGWILPLAGLFSLAAIPFLHAQRRDKAAFISSSVFIGAMLASTAFGLFPYVLPASTQAQYGLTVQAMLAPSYGLSVGIVWWSIGMLFAAGYFMYLFRSFGGKVDMKGEEY